MPTEFQGSLFDRSLSAEASPAKTYLWLESVLDWLEAEADSGSPFVGLSLSSSLNLFLSKTCPAFCPVGPATRQVRWESVQDEDGNWSWKKQVTYPSSWTGWQNAGMGTATGFLTLSTSESRSGAVACSLSDVLETGNVPYEYFLSPAACRGILRRAEKRGRELPKALEAALKTAAAQPMGEGNTTGPIELATACNANERYDFDSETFIAGTLNSGGNTGGFRTEPGEHIVFDTTQITSPGNYSAPKPGDACHPLASGAHPPAVAFNASDYANMTFEQSDLSRPITGSDDRSRGAPIVFQCQGSNVGPMGTLRSGHSDVQSGVPFTFQTRFARNGRNGRGGPDEITGALTSAEGGTHADSKPHVATRSGVRRLTPRECERLQGFPDDWTRWDDAGKEIADSPRYRMLGNAVNLVVGKWLANRVVKESLADLFADSTRRAE